MKREEKMTQRSFLLFLALSFICVFAYCAEEGNPVVSFELLLGRQINEVRAGAVPEKTDALKEIKSVLKVSDNYMDLDFALDAFRSFQKSPEALKNQRSLAPVAKLLMEKIDFSSVSAKRDLTAAKTEFKGFYTAFAKKPLKKGLALDNQGSKEWKPVIVSIKDTGSERRVKLLNDIAARHSGRSASSYSYKQSGDDLKTHNFILEGDSKFVERIASYYDAKRPSKPLSVIIELQSGGMFKKINSSVRIDSPAELDTLGALNWVNNKVIGKDWDFIYESVPDEFARHRSENKKDGKVSWCIKNGLIKYTVVYPGQPDIVLQSSENNSGTKYYEVR